MNKNLKEPRPRAASVSSFIQRAAAYAAGAAFLLVSAGFSVRTFDSASLKTTVAYAGFIALLVLWACLQACAEGFWTKRRVMLVFPFLVYAGWLAVSYLFNPYKIAGAEDFVNSLVFYLLPVLIALSVSEKGAGIINRFFVITAVICLSYGILQVMNLYVPGVDISPLAGFFNKQIFSTLVNPNLFADFAVIMFFVAAGNYFKTRNNKYFVLMSAAGICLFFTESKGGWLGFAGGAAAFVFLCVSFITSEKTKKYLKISMITAVAAVMVLTVLFSYKRIQSVNFRLVTWRGIWDMAAASPVAGGGSGSFAALYPAYKRAEIFYIEKGHNIETDHAENEYFEVLANNGIIGLALFLWLIIFVFTLVRRKLKEDGKPDWILIGFTAAAAAVLTQQFFDISLRRMSGGFAFGALNGVVLAICGADSLKDKEIKDKGFWFLLIKAAVFAAVAFVLALIISDFKEIAGTAASENLHPGRAVLRVAAWACALSVCGGILYIYGGLLKITKSFLPVVFILFSLPLFFVPVRYMQSDYYANLFNFYASRAEYAQAFEYAAQAFKINPFKISMITFRGWQMISRWDNRISNQPSAGDAPGALLDDAGRAERDLAFVIARTPNAALVHHNLGAAYLKKGKDLYETNNPQYRAAADKYLAMAEKEFKYSLLVDPVNQDSYFYLSLAEFLRGDFSAATRWIDAYEAGLPYVKNQDYLAAHKNQPRMSFMRATIKQAADNAK